MLTVTAWMHDIANSSVDRTVSPSAIIFPSSFIAPFSAKNQGANSDSPEMQYIHAVEAVFAVTTRLKVSLGLDTTKNLLVSPISTTTALAQLLLGARGPSRNRLLNILTATRKFRNIQEPTAAEFHVQLAGLIRFLQTNPNDDDAYQLHFASALFLQPGLTLLPNFQAAVTDLYGMDILPADFR
jgi:serine protease inhibitor